MPLYSYKCPLCGWHKEDMRRIEERHDGPHCWHDGTQMELQLDPVRGSVKNPAVPRAR